MKSFPKIFFIVFSVLYPLIVFGCLVVLKVDKRIFSLFVIFFGMIYLLHATAKKNFRENKNLFISATGMLCAGIFCLISKNDIIIKLYPFLMDIVFLWTFAYTLFNPPNFCFRLVQMTDKKNAFGMNRDRINRYCRVVTQIWVIYFIINGAVTLLTVFFPFEYLDRDIVWSVYNGGIVYANMGLLFVLEFIVRKVVNRKMPKACPISQFNASSRSRSMIMCYENKWSDQKYLTWDDFLRDSAKIRRYINSFPQTDKWILHCEDYWYFI
ncbi:MAG: acyl-CoA synthetase, partial [Treponema sp.]|nr:acyl-CoA synthetase [Treponema sp.]